MRLAARRFALVPALASGLGLVIWRSGSNCQNLGRRDVDGLKVGAEQTVLQLQALNIEFAVVDHFERSLQTGRGCGG